MAPTFDSTYGDNPWAGITDKTREVFVPDLLNVFRRSAFFQQFIPFKVDMRARNADTMTFTTMYDLEPDITPLGLRQIWLDASQTDSETKSITLEHHGDKVTLHKYDEYITQWRKTGLNGLRAINRNLLAVSLVEYLDQLARNALLSGTWKLYGADGSKADFSALATNGDDDFDPAISDDIYLGMQTRAMPGAVDAAGLGEGTMIALTTPGVIFEIQKDASTNGWISRHQYANQQNLLRYEVGTYRGVRYLQHPSMILWNSGVVNFQETITDPLYPGAGADRNVDANRVTGQETLANGNRYIQLSGTPVTGTLASNVSVNDMITIHTVRTSADGVTNGVDYRSGMNTHRRVVSVDTVNNRITVDKPILKDYTTDLGSGVYGYVTMGHDVHTTAYLTGPNAVVAGVAQPPALHAPPPIDDVQAFYRFAWDAYLKYQIWSDHAVEIVHTTGQYRIKGSKRR